MDRVIVGIDGSPGSRAALRFAAQEAERWGVPLVAVQAWELSPLLVAAGPVPETEEMSKEVARQLDEVLVEELGADRADTVETMVVEDPAVRALLDVVTPEDLIVIGSRGLGGFKGMVLGSVSQQVVRYAACPVTIVRSSDDNT